MDLSVLAGVDRLVSIDFETTGKRTIASPDWIARQPKGWRPPGLIIEIGGVELLKAAGGWEKGRTFHSLVNPDAPVDPKSIAVHGIHPAKLKNAPRFPQVMDELFAFLADSRIVAHAYENERDMLAYEFARAGRIPWGAQAVDDQRWICTQRIYAGLFPGAPRNLDAVCDRLWIDRSDRFAAHGALLDADLTADALLQMAAKAADPDAGPRAMTFA